MTRQAFSFVKENEPVWDASTHLIQTHFPLFRGKATPKAFEDFLRSPFLVKKTKGYDPVDLFRAIHRKYKRKENPSARIVDLLRITYDKNGLARDENDLQQKIASLCAEIVRFRAYCFARDSKEEEARLTTEAIRNEGAQEIFTKAVYVWAEEAEKMPQGAKRAFHRWAAADAGYASLEVNKTKSRQQLFNDCCQQLLSFRHLQFLIYETEYVNLKNIYGPDFELSTGLVVVKDGDVHRLYKKMKALLEATPPKEIDYFNFKRDFIRHAHAISWSDQIALYLFTINFLARLRRDFPGTLEREISWWPHFVIRARIHLSFPFIPKRLFNNQLQSLFINKELRLARRAIAQIDSLIKPEDREYLKLLSSIGLAFYEEDYKRVLKLLLGVTVTNWEGAHEDAMRLKSFKLRAVLQLMYLDASDEKVQAYYKSVNKDIDQYLKRHTTAQFARSHFHHMKNFLKICRSIFTLLYKGSSAKISWERILNMVNDTSKPLHARDWLRVFLTKIKPIIR